jgi:hypothetical protein
MSIAPKFVELGETINVCLLLIGRTHTIAAMMSAFAFPPYGSWRIRRSEKTQLTCAFPFNDFNAGPASTT